MTAGRPSIYSPGMVFAAQEYVDGLWKSEGDVVPTVEGLALYLKISKDTIYAWCKDPEKELFSDVIGTLKAKQGHLLIQGGLKNDFSSVISKLLLSSKHDYSEKNQTDITTNGESLGVVILPPKEVLSP